LLFLSKRYTFVSLTTAQEILDGTISPIKNAMAVTIDDGYQNSFEVAWPVLNKFGITPTVFIVTDNVTKPSAFWFDRLDRALQMAAEHNCDFEFRGVSFSPNANQSAAELRDLCNAVIDLSHELDDDHRRSSLEALITNLESETGWVASQEADLCSDVMNAKQLRLAHQAGVDLGSHTASHRRLSRLSEDERIQELRGSKAIMDGITNKSCHHIAYPEGFFDNKVCKATRYEGYKMGLTTQEGLNEIGCNLFTLKRIHLGDFGSDTLLWTNTSGLNARWAELSGGK